MAKSKYNRRDFLKASALGTSALALSGCATIDRYFTGDFRNLTNEVVILGAGAAGLAAAYELKRRKIPFRIFEASSRVGGRVHSVRVFPSLDFTAELGAEFFDRSHEQVHRMARELNIPLIELETINGLEPHFFYLNQKILKSSDIVQKIKTLEKVTNELREKFYPSQRFSRADVNLAKHSAAKNFDSQSIKDLLGSWRGKVDPALLQLLDLQCVAQFGVESENLSAMHFVETLDEFGTSLLVGKSQFRVQGGATRLIQTLADRVAGVIPDHVLKMNHPLVEILEKKGSFELTFQTPQGKRTYFSSHVICTIPFTKLRSVKGIFNLAFAENKKELIAQQSYGTHSKGFLTFPSPFWRQKQGAVSGNLGNFAGDFLSQRIWDAGRGQELNFGVLTYQRGGRSGLEAKFSSYVEARDDLQIFYSQLPQINADQCQMVNWARRPWSQGSIAVFRKGEYLKYKGIAAESDYSGRFQLAGEHTSQQYSGTLQGAFETGVRAASEVVIQS